MSIFEAMAAAYDATIWGRLKGGADETGRRGIRAALAEAERLGFVLVPKEPTENMIGDAVKLCDVEGGPCCDYTGVWPKATYRAMLAARPSIESEDG